MDQYMDTRVAAALVAAMTAIVLAIWSLATSRITRSLALKAEETAKRGELVRVKALEAIDTVLEAIWDLMQVVASFRGLVLHSAGVNLEDPEVKELVETWIKRLDALARLRIRSAPYLTSEIDARLDQLIQTTLALKFDSQHLDHVSGQLKGIVKSISDICKKEYLS